MSRVEEVVLKVHTNLMKSRDINRESSRDLEVRRRNGIDSLGIVSIILEIEEELGIELDECLAAIRKCRTIGDIIDVIEAKVVK